MTSRHLLTDYDLKPGRYQLTASGKAGLIGGIARLPFTTTLPLEVVAASERGLQAAFAPLVAAAASTTADGWWQARIAIVESAPPFLESLIARFAADGLDGAVEALGRIATTSSRAQRIEDTGILIDIPSQLAHTAEDWILVAGTRDRGAPRRDVTAVRVR